MTPDRDKVRLPFYLSLVVIGAALVWLFLWN